MLRLYSTNELGKWIADRSPTATEAATEAVTDDINGGCDGTSETKTQEQFRVGLYLHDQTTGFEGTRLIKQLWQSLHAVTFVERIAFAAIATTWLGC